MFLYTASAWAQDPLEVADPETYQLKFENERVRVMELNLKPGSSIPEHSHPDHFVYILSGGKLKLTHPDGTVAEVEGKEGQVMWLPAETHSTVNIGDTEVKAVVVELKP